MRSGISEFSYGYAVTEAFIYDNGTPITAAPVFPSLIEEGRQGGGYDLRLDRPGIPLFLQFKLSDYLKARSNSLEVKQGLFSQPFYRMHLRPKRRSDQHQLLMDWESQGNEVYYVAPVFYELAQLNDAYLNRQILQRSVFFRPSDIGTLPDDEDHHVAFQVPGDAYLLSQPQQIRPPLNFDIFARHLFGRLSQTNFSIGSIAQSFISQMIELYSTYRSDIFTDIRDIYGLLQRFSDPLQQMAFMSRILLDSNLYIIQARNG